MKLFYKSYGQGPVQVVIIHGLLGSGRNWHTVAGRLGERYRVIVPDMRNHGRSPHAASHHLSDMVEDVYELLQDLDAVPAVVMGHSMGGLVAMEMAFRTPEVLQGVIVIDIVPRPHRAGVSDVLEAMAQIQVNSLESKKEAEEALARAIDNPVVRQFVLTNLVVTEAGLQWRINLPVLQAFLIESQAYRPSPTDVYEGPALFIRGGKSNYIQDDDFALIRHHFPRVRIETVEKAGHWVHYDAPDELMAIIEKFLADLKAEPQSSG